MRLCFAAAVFLLSTVIVPLAECFEIGDISVAGNNRLEWWLRRKTKEEVFDNRFDINAYYQNFLLGFRYQVLEPSDVGDRREGFYRRYIEYSGRNFGVRAGNFYTMFGRGLVLRAYEDDVILLDRDIDGVRLKGNTEWGDLTVISGRPRNTEFPELTYEVTNDTNDILRGGDVSIHPFSFVSVGASYLLLTQADWLDRTIFRRTEVYGSNVSLGMPHLDLYGEVAKKWGYDEFLRRSNVSLPGHGTGYGIYGSASLSFPGYGIAFQFADYDSLALGGGDQLDEYRYNSPPVLNRYGQSINRGLDERGYQVESYISPLEPLHIDISYSDLETADSTLYFKEVFAEGSYEQTGLFELRSEYDRTEQHEILTDILDREENIPSSEATWYITSNHSLKVGYEHRMVSDSTGTDSLGRREEFTDRKLILSYTFSPYVTVTLEGEQRDREVEHEPGREWRSVQVDWTITQEHRLTITVGTERGGFECSGGVCTDIEPFDGVRVILTSMF